MARLQSCEHVQILKAPHTTARPRPRLQQLCGFAAGPTGTEVAKLRGGSESHSGRIALPVLSLCINPGEAFQSPFAASGR